MAATFLKRIEANRQNAQKSTGPKDVTATRFNAVKHGLLAEGVTELDDVENFASLVEQLEHEYAPTGLFETFLVRRIALCMIRLQRACMIEAEFITADLNPTITTQTTAEILEDVALGVVEVLEPGLPARLSSLAVEDLANKFQRYETAIENKLYRAVNQLDSLQQSRREGAKASAKTIKRVANKHKQLASFGNQL